MTEKIKEILRYPKINTLYKRKKKKIQIGKFSISEYSIFEYWRVFEKVDGTNIRIIYSSVDNILNIDSRFENELIPEVQNKINESIKINTMENVFPEKDGKPSQVVLFGEGSGPRIGNFGIKNFKEYDFYLFDVFALDQHEKRRNIRGWWLSPDNVIDVANKLGVKHVPDLGVMDIEEIIDHVKSKPKSNLADDIIEGIVAKSIYNVLDREGNPLQFKLKVSDYVHLDG